MLGEKINYDKIARRMSLQLYDLHKEIFEININVREIMKMQLWMWNFVKRDQLKNFSKTTKRTKDNKYTKELDDMETFNNYLNKIDRDATRILHKRWQERMKDYKESLTG